MPGGVAKTFIPTKEAEQKSAYDEWLARIVCFAFSIAPQALIAQVNRATAETARATALEEGLAPLQSWVKQLIDDVLITEFDASDLEFAWRDDSAPDAQQAASIAQIYVTNGIKSINEARAELGLDPVQGGEKPLVFTGSGPMPLDKVGASNATAKLAKYSPDQPRDERGRWTSGGGDDGSTALAGGREGADASATPGSSPGATPVRVAENTATGTMSDAGGVTSSAAGNSGNAETMQGAGDQSNGSADSASRSRPAVDSVLLTPAGVNADNSQSDLKVDFDKGQYVLGVQISNEDDSRMGALINTLRDTPDYPLSVSMDVTIETENGRYSRHYDWNVKLPPGGTIFAPLKDIGPVDGPGRVTVHVKNLGGYATAMTLRATPAGPDAARSAGSQ